LSKFNKFGRNVRVYQQIQEKVNKIAYIRKVGPDCFGAILTPKAAF